MKKNSIVDEAIADAKAVKETAYANVKLALEEALAPHIQSMISAKLTEDLDEDVTMESAEGVTTEEAEYGTDDMTKVKDMSEANDKEDESDKKEKTDEASDALAEAESEEDDEDKMTEMELEALIRELEEELNSSDIGQGDNKEPSDVSSSADTDDPGKGDIVKAEGADEVGDGYGNDMSGEDKHMISLDELIKALREMDDEDEPSMDETSHEDDDDEMKMKMETLESDLKEAYETIEYLRKEINEVNLLNAKYMYTTKLFKKFDLTDPQKVKVVESIDRTKTMREAKLVYTTLAEAFIQNKNKKTSLKESFASNPMTSTKPSAQTTQILREDNDLASRFKKLAGIKN